MGLENGIVLHTKDTKAEILLDYYCSWDSFDRWLKRNCKEVEEDVFLITPETVKLLRSDIQETALTLLKLPRSRVAYYDINGYPEHVAQDVFGCELMGYDLNHGCCIVSLYFSLEMMGSILENNSNTYITAYSSC